MLNNAMYYGQKLKVRMERSPSETILLPKGLTTIGQGLGVKGKPLRNIVKHYKKLIANESSLLNPSVVDLPDGCEPKETPEVHFEIKPLTTKTTTGVQEAKPTQTTAKQNSTQNHISSNTNSKNSSNSIPTVSRPQNQPKQNNAQFRPNLPFHRGPRPMGPGTVRPGNMGPGPVGPGPMGPGPFGPRPMGPRMMGNFGNGWNGPGPVRGPMPGPGHMGPGHMGPGPMVPGPMQGQNMGIFNSNEPVQLQLSNVSSSAFYKVYFNFTNTTCAFSWTYQYPGGISGIKIAHVFIQGSSYLHPKFH